VYFVMFYHTGRGP